jgi:regulator of protease activity HflC (stomatin/prohibitin superfamily)
MDLWSFAIGAGVFFGMGSTSFKIVNQGEEALVASFGKYKRKLPAGPHFILPFIDTVSYKGSIKEQVLDIPPRQCITRDNVSITADAVIYWRVVDMEKAFYRVENLRQAMSNIILTQIRAELGSLELDEGIPVHAARQLPSGMWTSKLGALEDIEHQLEGLAGDRYGKIGQILKRSK